MLESETNMQHPNVFALPSNVYSLELGRIVIRDIRMTDA